MAVDSIPLLGLAEVMPVVVSKRDPHVSTSEPDNVAAGRSATRPPMEGSGSAERQPKLVVTQRPVTMPTHDRPPTSRSLSGAAARPDGEPTAIEIKRTIPLFPTLCITGEPGSSLPCPCDAYRPGHARVTRRLRSSAPRGVAGLRASRRSRGWASNAACHDGPLRHSKAGILALSPFLPDDGDAFNDERLRISTVNAAGRPAANDERSGL
jgi:hypothetical protein